jgi:hypothetical protein
MYTFEYLRNLNHPKCVSGHWLFLWIFYMFCLYTVYSFFSDYNRWRLEEKTIEPRHDITKLVGLRPAWIQTRPGSLLFAYQLYYKWRNWQRITLILIRLRGCAGWSGSMLVANALRWFCRDAAQLLIATFQWKNRPMLPGRAMGQY